MFTFVGNYTQHLHHLSNLSLLNKRSNKKYHKHTKQKKIKILFKKIIPKTKLKRGNKHKSNNKRQHLFRLTKRNASN